MKVVVRSIRVLHVSTAVVIRNCEIIVHVAIEILAKMCDSVACIDGVLVRKGKIVSHIAKAVMVRRCDIV